MKRLVAQCPVCQQNLKIATLQCPDCGLELRNSFEMSVFDKLRDEQYNFLMIFLKNRGNLRNLQNELKISYPLAKKRLDDLLTVLGTFFSNVKLTETFILVHITSLLFFLEF